MLTNTLSQGSYTSDDYNPIAKKYVKSPNINIRNAPINGKIVGSLKQGQSVLVYDRISSWERISKENQQPKWVSSSLLCSGEGCYINSSKNYIKSNLNSPKTKSTTSRTHKSTSSSYGGSCPCSSSSNCFGPRGGRYCITSGGNKRYR
ncbi:SH3 domain-containing protein [Acinetobacter chinensis]|uniref:SH3 domain-containing protein n=1 Tax=Acinetobacter chinensis TaxID=2004650 RepID=A0A3B7M239_9GAMM|nr:SH3 domain-containing protein [Acinetobacter chinensis]